MAFADSSPFVFLQLQTATTLRGLLSAENPLKLETEEGGPDCVPPVLAADSPLTHFSDPLYSGILSQSVFNVM